MTEGCLFSLFYHSCKEEEKMKKLVTAALVLAMTVGCLAGCSGSGASEEKDRQRILHRRNRTDNRSNGDLW